MAYPGYNPEIGYAQVGSRREGFYRGKEGSICLVTSRRNAPPNMDKSKARIHVLEIYRPSRINGEIAGAHYRYKGNIAGRSQESTTQ